jgi:hypothetical protein
MGKFLWPSCRDQGGVIAVEHFAEHLAEYTRRNGDLSLKVHELEAHKRPALEMTLVPTSFLAPFNFRPSVAPYAANSPAAAAARTKSDAAPMHDATPANFPAAKTTLVLTKLRRSTFETYLDQQECSHHREHFNTLLRYSYKHTTAANEYYSPRPKSSKSEISRLNLPNESHSCKAFC